MKFRDTPIRRKLTVVILLTSVTVMLVARLSFFIFEYVTFRQATTRHVSTLAQVIAANSTDGMLAVLPLKVLADDRHYFPPYEAVPLFRVESLRTHPGIAVALDRLAGKVSAEEVRGMNFAVDSQHKDVGDVVRGFRKVKGL